MANESCSVYNWVCPNHLTPEELIEFRMNHKEQRSHIHYPHCRTLVQITSYTMHRRNQLRRMKNDQEIQNYIKALLSIMNKERAMILLALFLLTKYKSRYTINK